MINPLIQKFGKEKRFVTWKLQTRQGKQTKIPYTLSGKLASSTDHTTWATYEEIASSSLPVGIVFTPDQMLLGIDIDHCLEKNKIVHEQKEIIEKFIEAADTYTEISPSKTGLHLFISITASLTLKGHKKAPFELYTGGRYFTVTEKIFGKKKDVRTVKPEEAETLLAIIGYPWSLSPVPRVLSTSSPLPIDDSSLLHKIFASKNGQDIERLYNGDITAYNGDDSSADLALCSYLAFWTARDATQMERMWLASPLGQRKKTVERKDYRDSTILKAIGGCKEVYESPKARADKVAGFNIDDLNLMFVTTREKEKKYIQNTENACRILRKHPEFAGKIRYDIFRNVLEVNFQGRWRSYDEGDDIHVQTKISILFPFFGMIGKQMAFDALLKVARENITDSAADWIKKLKWDGEARLDSWLSKTYGVADDKYHRSVGSNWMKGLVKRMVEPGCKFDYVLVLEGKQGSKKSTSLSILGGEWHVETTMSTDTKDFFMQFQGKAIIEFSEGETLSRTEVKRMKAIITMQNDRYRLPFGRTSMDFPRHCVFAMTTNQEEYLKDETGNRRWLPVALIFEEADINWLAMNREQLFAEAYVRVMKGETIYEFPKEEMIEAQEARRIHDPNTDVVSDWYFERLTDNDRRNGITVYQAYRDALHGGFQTKPMNKFDEMCLVDIFKTSLKLVSKRTRVDGKQFRCWIPKNLLPVEELIQQEIQKW